MMCKFPPCSNVENSSVALIMPKAGACDPTTGRNKYRCRCHAARSHMHILHKATHTGYYATRTNNILLPPQTGHIWYVRYRKQT